MSTVMKKTDVSNISDEELQVQNLVARGEIDQAIAIYQQLKPESAHIFYTIGVLYAEKKGDYDLAISCYEQALHMQGETDENNCQIFTRLGVAYQNRGQFDLALTYHFRALNLQQLSHNIDNQLLTHSLFGIANAYWGQQNLSEALKYAQQALIFNESIPYENDLNIGTSLAILANIYHHSGDDIRALELAKRALITIERTVSPDSPLLAPLLNNIGTIQFGAGQFNDALVTFVQVLHICERTLPKQHPKRITINNNIQRIIQMQQHHVNVYSFSRLWTMLSKVLLL